MACSWKGIRSTGYFPSEFCVWCKGKAIPLQAWIGLEGSRRMRLPDFKTIGT